MIELKTSLGR